MKIPSSHPRYESLRQRERIIEGLKEGYVTYAGLIAQGRGEAFDYLLGERTTEEAKEAEKVAVALLLLAKHPVISVNGNVAVLVPKEIVTLAKLLNAKVEINLFYRSEKRAKLIEKILRINGGAEEVLGVEKKVLEKTPYLDSERGRVDKRGIFKSDVVLVSLEDGDRTEALIKEGKKVIAIDLNPLSRTSKKATITIVDNIVRAIPNMIKIAKELKRESGGEKLRKVVDNFNNKKNLNKIIKFIRSEI
jgi:4-phosphopantoate--beta-alanine ligase